MLQEQWVPPTEPFQYLRVLKILDSETSVCITAQYSQSNRYASHQLVIFLSFFFPTPLGLIKTPAYYFLSTDLFLTLPKSSFLSWESVQIPVLDTFYWFFVYKFLLSFPKGEPSIFFDLLSLYLVFVCLEVRLARNTFKNFQFFN